MSLLHLSSATTDHLSINYSILEQLQLELIWSIDAFADVIGSQKKINSIIFEIFLEFLM